MTLLHLLCVVLHAPRHSLRAVGTSWLLPTSMLGVHFMKTYHFTSCTSPTFVITAHFMTQGVLHVTIVNFNEANFASF